MMKLKENEMVLLALLILSISFFSNYINLILTGGTVDASDSEAAEISNVLGGKASQEQSTQQEEQTGPLLIEQQGTELGDAQQQIIQQIAPDESKRCENIRLPNNKEICVKKANIQLDEKQNKLLGLIGANR